jgi:hypothetical protein
LSYTRKYRVCSELTRYVCRQCGVEGGTDHRTSACDHAYWQGGEDELMTNSG